MSIETVRRYFETLGIADRIIELADSSATVALAAQVLGCDPDRIAKTLAFEAADGGTILVVASGASRIDNHKFKSFFGHKARMLSAEDTLERVGHAVGGVCPFAVKEGVKIYIDVSVKKYDTVYPACGSSNSAVKMTPEEILDYAKATDWADVCKAPAAAAAA